MQKVLVIMLLLAVFACKKEQESTPYRNFYGKWIYVTAVAKQYTVSQGDTNYYRIDTLHYGGGDHIDFTQAGVAYAFSAATQRTDSLRYEEITPVFFKLDSMLCEATHISDTALEFNSLDFSYDETPLVKISQTFYSLRK
ncbi:hypothetical protein F0L74_20275 [Chitinophaga agrisoli]|uniref:Lipocalin-like protein n=1 Tax=Chitinophaga agrisoli TaxID=2607653 RepID=A0A5B2VG85_9BACT|nr:hypothetical protein [Chitinophaga agrisoli]KAA2238563.1 hypothetical protein F0L74_20275 [Chitinophaga agrisoli]